MTTIASGAAAVYQSTGPTVVGRYPAANATGVLAGSSPAVRFDRVVKGVTATSFVLRRSDGTSVSAVVTDLGDATKYALNPNATLEAGMTYHLSLSSAITSVEGGALTPTSWSFTVAAAPAPAPGTTTYDPPRSLTFLTGTHTGYKFDASGHVTASKTATLTSNSSAPTNQRRSSMPGQTGAWFQVTAGIWAGYWVRESPKIYLPGISALTTYSPARLVGFAAGTYTGYRFDSSGHVIASKSATLASSSSASADQRAIINGRPYLGIINGVWAGYWLAESASVFLR
jgi:hypothetical protein